MIVDTHSHLFPPEWESSGFLPHDMFEVDAVLQRQAEAGIDLTIVSDPHIWYGERDLGDIGCTREYNDFAAGLAADHAGRVGALATVTPWRGEDHVAEAERAVRELGLPGIAVATSDRGEYLDEAPESFWELAEDLGVPVFLHPGGTVVGQDKMGTYRLGELCGRPLDMTLTLSRLILTGVLERHAGVRLLCAHAGGGICMIADRLDFGHELRDYKPLGPWGEVRLERPPSEYVRRLYLDTVTFGVAPLRLALETVGVEHVVFATDGPPVPIAASRHVDVVRELGLDDEGTAAILGGNARGLFDLNETGE
ncbi:amidohydrolase [Geodermatophilus sp. DF01-2]|uniref:amidohydrolase family protein n=1 Tax=Geodermatophilus sp. DF01-2 TaxID=2559610 RepID=UPI00107484F4|nr:amidohydrolase family protein [Geodermatophilus sp. DF01_2]TFV59834.1 amidohydrolase [Geodermatophilus sp. DF01_2]